MTSKTQLGWRCENADTELYAPLFKYGYQQGMHLITYGEKGTKWASFVPSL